MARPSPDSLRGLCYYCIKLIKWIPVLFIVIIIVWSYYAYVHQLCVITVQSNVQKVLYLIFYHIIFVMVCWTYTKTIYTNIGKVPNIFKLPDMEYELLNQAESIEIQHQILEQFARELPVTNINMNGSVRYCEKCKHIKPDRTHHCSVCGECVLKMDHHCPWVNNCVCFTNYKFFVLFLGYALLYCIYIVLTSLPYFVAFWRGELEGIVRFHILFLFFVALMFGVSLVSLFSYHCYLISENRTTLEAFRAPIFRGTGADRNGFHLGCYRNFQEVFGENPSKWLFPTKTSQGDGVTFSQLQLGEEREGLLKSEDDSS